MKSKIISLIALCATFAASAEECFTYVAKPELVTVSASGDGAERSPKKSYAYFADFPLDDTPPTAEEDTQKQLDGIKEQLRVMAKSESSDVEKVEVFRIHLYRNADGSEVAYVVGVDGKERPVVLVSPLEYRLLTERLDAVWQSLHSTADGRKKLHGKLERTEIDEKARQKVEIYADGFRHTETLPAKRKPSEVEMTRLQAKIKEQKSIQAKIAKQKPKWMSDKRWEMEQAFTKFRNGAPKQVTIEHDAVTGKDTVVEGK